MLSRVTQLGRTSSPGRPWLFVTLFVCACRGEVTVKEEPACVPIGPGPVGAEGLPGVDASSIVYELTVEEATTWCEWFVDAFPPGGQPRPSPNPPNPAYPGFALGYSTIECTVPSGPNVWLDGVCIARLPVSECVTSLLRGACNATVEMMNECVLTVFKCADPALPPDDPYAWIHGEGCARLWDLPGCWHTVVQMPSLVEGCGVWLEDLPLPCPCFDE